MASVNFMKCKTVGEAKAMIRHCDKEERLKHEHSNKEINKESTKDNFDFTRLGYQEVCAKYDDRIKNLDETTNTNKRKDRITCFGLTIPACEGMNLEESKQFFFDVIKLMLNRFGKENVLAAYGHVDEIHDYIDHGEVKTSRAHLHVYVVPELDGRLNGKKFSSKSSMQTLNKEIDRLAQEKYKRRFLTKEKPRNLTVEQLKELSAAEQTKRIQDRDRLEDEIKHISTERQTVQNNLDKSKEELDRLNEAKTLREEAYNHFKPEELNYPQTKEKKTILGKKTIEIDSVAYEDFISKVQDMEEVVVEAKEDQAELKAQIRRADRAEYEIREITQDRDEVQKCAELVAKENEHLRSSLSKIENYAKDQQDRNLESFVKRVLAFDIVKAVEKAKTVTKTISRSSRDDDYER